MQRFSYFQNSAGRFTTNTLLSECRYEHLVRWTLTFHSLIFNYTVMKQVSRQILTKWGRENFPKPLEKVLSLYVGKNGFQIVTLLGELFWNILQTIKIVVVWLETLRKAQQVSLCSFIPLLKRECHEIFTIRFSPKSHPIGLLINSLKQLSKQDSFHSAESESVRWLEKFTLQTSPCCNIEYLTK